MTTRIPAAISANACSELFLAEVQVSKLSELTRRFWQDPSLYELFRRIRPNNLINIPKEPFSVSGKVMSLEDESEILSVIITGIANADNVYQLGQFFIINQWTAPKGGNITGRTLAAIIRGAFAEKIRNPEIQKIRILFPTVESKYLAKVLEHYGFQLSDRKIPQQELDQIALGPSSFYEVTLDLQQLQAKIPQVRDLVNTDFSFPEKPH